MRGVQSVRCILRERRPVVELVPRFDLLRVGCPICNLPFEGGVDQDWGHVMLKSYYYVLGTNKLTALNVTFSLIKWNSLRMRFKEVGGDKKNFCRDFHLSLEVPDSTVLFFDCLWSKAEYEKKSFGFEYEQRSSLGSYAHRSYVFVVPSGDHIREAKENWHFFTAT
uniref:Uncharacterized protein n=1 Tax=Timema poppense TaxID=170557 RepID=A0A7R9H8I2_TIMPO|nr:unnamed protein product [Timema poppensis]